MKEFKKEIEVVKALKKLFEEKQLPILKKTFIHTNLSTKKFQDIWSDWWETKPPPRLEVDMILVFEDVSDPRKVFLAGVETKFFRDGKRNFYEGLQQVLSFGLFGFDSLVLWHIFSEEVDNETIAGGVKSVEEILKGFGLPVVYFATKLIDDFKFEFFAPGKEYSSAQREVEYLLRSMRDCCGKNRNTLLNEEIEKRRNTLKVILKIPL